MALRATYYNKDIPWLEPTLTEESHYAVSDMLDCYSPFGEIRTVTTTLRAGIGTDGYQGSATPMSLDHVFRRMLGLPALNVGLDRDIYGGGKGLTLCDSVLSSLGEAIERMLGAFSSVSPVATHDQWYGSVAELRRLGRCYVGPDELRLFSTEQFANPGFLCEPWTDDSRMRWSPGRNLLNGETVWVPAQLVHLFYARDRSEARIGVSSSGGLAAHQSPQRAICHGILELIERDATNLSWYCRVPPQRVDLDRPISDSHIRRWLDSSQRAGVKVDFYAHRTTIPDICVMTVIATEPDRASNCFLAGGGVAFDSEQAIRSAISELIQAERMVRTSDLVPSWGVVRGFRRLFGIEKDARPSDFQNFIQVVPYYGYPENQKKLDWYFRDPTVPTVALSTLPSRHLDYLDELAFALELCDRCGLTPIQYDFTPENFRSVSLQKIVIPELVPAFPPNLMMLGHRRYGEFPVALGLRASRMPFEELNAEPLPYP